MKRLAFSFVRKSFNDSSSRLYEMKKWRVDLIMWGLQKWEVCGKQGVSFRREVDVSHKLQGLIWGLLLPDAQSPEESALSGKSAVFNKKQAIKKCPLIKNNPRIIVFLPPSPMCHLPVDKMKQYEAISASGDLCPSYNHLAPTFSLDLLNLIGFIFCFSWFLFCLFSSHWLKCHFCSFFFFQVWAITIN